MAIWKCTATLRQVTGARQTTLAQVRTAGWSETWYFNGSLTDAQLRFGGNAESWCLNRAQLLPDNGSITEQRYQQVNPAGPTAVTKNRFTGASTLGCDAPQVALLCSYPSRDLLNTRHWAIRDLPDARQQDGEYNPSQKWGDALVVFNFYIRENFIFRAVDHSTTKSKIITISVPGLVTTKTPHGLVAGQEVFVSRAINNVTTRSFSSIEVVADPVPSATTFNVVGGFEGIAYHGGTCRRYGILYPQVDIPFIERTVTRKVGRPSEEYSGRAKAKRR